MCTIKPNSDYIFGESYKDLYQSAWYRLMSYQATNTISRLVLMYGSQIWTLRRLRKAENNLLERTEMRMLRWMMGIKRIETRNEETRAGVVNRTEKIRETRLKEMVRSWDMW